MNEESVRRDVHDAEIRRIFRDMEDLREEIRCLEARNDSLSLNVAIIAVVFALTIFIVSTSIRFLR